MAKVTMKERKDKLSVLLDGLVAAGAEFTQENADAVTGIFGSQVVSTKVDADGNVFCTYFQAYLPADQFSTSKKGKIDSMCAEGKKLHRTQKSMVNKATNEVLKNYRSKDISAKEMDELLSSIDGNAGHRFPQGTASIPTNYPFSLENEPEAEPAE